MRGIRLPGPETPDGGLVLIAVGDDVGGEELAVGIVVLRKDALAIAAAGGLPAVVIGQVAVRQEVLMRHGSIDGVRGGVNHAINQPVIAAIQEVGAALGGRKIGGVAAAQGREYVARPGAGAELQADEVNIAGRCVCIAHGNAADRRVIGIGRGPDRNSRPGVAVEFHHRIALVGLGGERFAINSFLQIYGVARLDAAAVAQQGRAEVPGRGRRAGVAGGARRRYVPVGRHSRADQKEENRKGDYEATRLHVPLLFANLMKVPGFMRTQEL